MSSIYQHLKNRRFKFGRIGLSGKFISLRTKLKARGYLWRNFLDPYIPLKYKEGRKNSFTLNQLTAVRRSSKFSLRGGDNKNYVYSKWIKQDGRTLRHGFLSTANKELKFNKKAAHYHDPRTGRFKRKFSFERNFYERIGGNLPKKKSLSSKLLGSPVKWRKCKREVWRRKS